MASEYKYKECISDENKRAATHTAGPLARALLLLLRGGLLHFDDRLFPGFLHRPVASPLTRNNQTGDLREGLRARVCVPR